VSDERARLFVALDLPETVVAALVAWRMGALAHVAGLRLLAPESLHVTLCFLGSLPASDIEPIGDACERAVSGAVGSGAVGSGLVDSGPVVSGLSLSELVWLPRRRPQVAAVAIDDPVGALTTLQAAVAAALIAGGWYEPENRSFLAHVTVGRAGRRVRIRPPESITVPPSSPFSAPSVTLFRSRPGSVYEALRTVPLG
jgi:2'-5' RNA ligase